MDRLLAYEMFVAVARLESFSKAARKLGHSPQALSRGIQGLEARLGQRLFHRSTRAVSLTAQGAALLPQAARALADLADAELALRGATADPAGELRITAPVMFGRLHVLPVVTELLNRHERLGIELLLVDRNIRLIEEGIDVAVRIGHLPDSALRAVRIGQVRPVIVASPAYLARHSAPHGADDLAGHDLIASTGPRGQDEWRFRSRPAEASGWRRRLRVNTVDSALAAAEAGMGLANLLSYQVAASIAAGRLIEVMPSANAARLPVSLLFDAARASAPATRAFIEAMRQREAEGRWS